MGLCAQTVCSRPSNVAPGVSNHPQASPPMGNTTAGRRPFPRGESRFARVLRGDLLIVAAGDRSSPAAEIPLGRGGPLSAPCTPGFPGPIFEDRQ